jgi:hypothetical protein
MWSYMGAISSRIKSVIIEYKFLLFLLTVGFWTLPVSTFLPSSGLDPSWRIGTNLIFLNNFQFGTDFIFTYGLLGFLGNPVILNYNLWIMSFVFTIFAHFLFVIALYLLFKYLSARWYQYILFIPIFLFILPIMGSFWVLLISISIILYLILLQKVQSKTVFFYLTLCGFLLAVDSLIKFDMLWNSLYLLLGFCVISFIFKRNARQGAILVGSYAVSFIALWFTSQQHFLNIIAYLIGGFELTKGYTDAMAFPGPFWQVCFGLISILILVMIGLFFLIRRNKTGFLFLILNLVILFSAFKSGFVRHDGGHILEFLGVFILFFGFLLIFITNESKNRDNKKFYCTMIVFITITIGMLMTLTYITAPWVLQNNVISQESSHEFTLRLLSDQTYFDLLVDQQKEKIKREYPVNATLLKSIDNSSIDIFPWDIALCWAYDLNWTPRPVFQSYSVYTPYLDTRNGQHFNDPAKSPEKILYSYGSIDGRYPLFDEPKTFRAIINNYTYADEFGEEYILLNRSLESIKYKDVDLGSTTVKMGDPVKIPSYNGEIFANVTIKYSLMGDLMKIIRKPAPIYISFQLKNGFNSPKYRLIPDTAADGLYLSQYVSNSDTIAWMSQGHQINNIDSIIIETDQPGYYIRELGVQFVGIPHTMMTPTQSDLVYQNFSTIEGNVEKGTLGSNPGNYAFKAMNGEIKPAIFEHSEAGGSQIFMKDQMIPRNVSLDFSIALDSQTWSPDKGDGVEYQIYVNTITPENLIFSKYIDPKHNPDERKWNDYRVDLSKFAEQNVTFIFSTLPGPQNDTSWDWAWWGDMRIKK